MNDHYEDAPRASVGSVIIETVVVTTAVLPFIQELAKRAADDSYAYLKKLMYKARNVACPADARDSDAGTPSHEVPAGLLINDEQLNIRFLIDDNLPNEALNELRYLDLSAVPNSIIQWGWTGRTWAWTFQKVDDAGNPVAAYTQQGLLIPGAQGSWQHGRWQTSFVDTKDRTYRIYRQGS